MSTDQAATLAHFQCPRCKNRDFSLFRRGTLTNDSLFLPEEARGKEKAVKVPVRCTHCGYRWRSTSPTVGFILEEPDE